MADQSITYARVAAIALPVVLSNVTVPLQGAVDTAIIGNLGDAVYLAAVTLGASAIALLLALLYFLQFGGGGLAAQAWGAGDHNRLVNVLVRSLILAGFFGIVLVAAQTLIVPGIMLIYEGSAEAERLASVYVSIRIWAAPAELGILALSGWFAGQEQTRRLFEMQVITSVTNIILNLFFVLGLGLDVDGVALGTLIAAWLGFSFGLWRARSRVMTLVPNWRPDRARLLNRAELVKLMRLNRDILIRTVLLVAAATWMTRLGSQQGDVILAANGVLYQIFHVATYGLDGFAIAAESLVGQAAGARDRRLLRRSAVVSGIAAFWLAVGFSALVFALQGPLIRVFTNVEEVRAAAHMFYFWAAVMPLIGVAAYHLDGIFVGATESVAMRNAMIVSAGIYFAVSGTLAEWYGNHGIWAGYWVLLLLRAATLIVQYPALERRAAA
ncbi:MAG: MATE family efflux transporter [Pseudomonadota bacterium]